MSAAIAALSLAAACSGEQSQGENQPVAAAGEQEAADHNSMAMDPNNPFHSAEMQMNERMMAAQGENAADTWARKMVEHHRGAIEMTQVLEQQGGDPKVLEKARKSADEQRKEIQELERMLQGGISGSGAANVYAAAEKGMHDRMMAASGASPSERWIRKMIEHHRGAVEMSDIVIAQGGNQQVTAMARRSSEKQKREIAELEQMLRGETPSPAAAAPSGSATKSRAAAAPAAAKSAAAEPTRSTARSEAPRAKATAAEPAADPHAGHDMSNMSNMSH